MNESAFSVLIAVVPLAAALLSPLFSYIKRELGKWVVICAIAFSFMSACGVLLQVLQSGTIHYHMGDWAPPIGIEFVLDPLNATLAVLATFVSLMVGIYGTPFMQDAGWLKMGGYYTLYGLLTAGLAGMIITGDVFNLYVFLEISSLACYGLIRRPQIGTGGFPLFGHRYHWSVAVFDGRWLFVRHHRYAEYGGYGCTHCTAFGFTGDFYRGGNVHRRLWHQNGAVPAARLRC